MVKILKIHRLRKQIFSSGVFKIFLDGEFVAYIANGDAKEISVELGRHSLQVSADWVKSCLLTFDVTADSEENFVVASETFSIWKIYKTLFYFCMLNWSPPGKIIHLKRSGL